MFNDVQKHSGHCNTLTVYVTFYRSQLALMSVQTALDVCLGKAEVTENSLILVNASLCLPKWM